MKEDITSDTNDVSIIKWTRLPHCPPNQLIRAHSTDAGYDICSAQDAYIPTLEQLEFVWEDFKRLDEMSEELKDKLTNAYSSSDFSMGNFRYSKDDKTMVQRKKYKFPWVKTGILIQVEESQWMGVYNRSSTSSKYNAGLINAVGVIDPYYSEELMVGLYSQHTPTLIAKGERIAQLIPATQLSTSMLELDREEYNASLKGERSGLGSTGTKEILGKVNKTVIDPYKISSVNPDKYASLFE